MTEWSEAWRALADDGDPRMHRRLHQGRAYHRAGRVTDLRVRPGGASARVQGDYATPYSPSVSVPTLGDDAWGLVTATLASQVRHTARLLAGHAPESLDSDLHGTGVHVVPERGELAVACDCGDEPWPCAHAAALWEALADEIEDDPFTLLRMRGRGRERLLGELATERRRHAEGDAQAGVPLADLDVSRWASARTRLDDVTVPEQTPPRSPAGSLRVLGDPPGWAGGVDAWRLLHPLVEGAAGWVAVLDED